MGESNLNIPCLYPESLAKRMCATIVIDMRCLQDERYIERGIPSHARSAIVHARAVSAFARNARIIGIIDPALDPIPPDIKAVLDETSPNAYIPALPERSIFLNPSPMEIEQINMGRLLLNPNILTAACVYDFIPLENQTHYLASMAKRLEYFSSLVWLNRYKMYLPISQHTNERLRAVLPVGARRTVVTGVPVASWLERIKPGKPTHVLVVAGDDPRKNPELALQAHAASREMQARRIMLIITGRYGAERAAQFRAMAADNGGDPELVSVPGRVSQAELEQQYRDALCVVTPSRAEGFSMPVIEAMAAGVPSIVSDIPAHASLVDDGALRFGVDDPPALTALLNKISADYTFRREIMIAQSEIWKPFRAKTVAEKLWSALDGLSETLPARPAVAKRPRVAMLTPLPPTKSGVAFFSNLLAQHLVERVDLDLFSENFRSAAEPLSAMPHLLPKFDRVVNVMGNSLHHEAIYDLQMRYGGACICHDARLMGLYTRHFGHAATARYASRELGRPVSNEELAAWHEDETKRAANFLGEVAATARPLILHAAVTVAEVEQRFGLRPAYLPFPIQRPFKSNTLTQACRRAARARLGLHESEHVIASFGFVHRIKGIAQALHALAALRDAGVLFRLIWVGHWDEDDHTFQDLARDLGIYDMVTFGTGYLAEATYHDYLLAADYGLQLRIGRPGGISAALQDNIAAGLPSVAAEDLANNLNAPSYVRRVPDIATPEAIRDAFIGLLSDGVTYESTEAERLDYCDRYSMEVYTARLCEVLEI